MGWSTPATQVQGPGCVATAGAILARQQLKKAAFRGAAPAISDHLFTLVHDHVERVFEDIVREMGARRDRRLSSRGDL